MLLLSFWLGCAGGKDAGTDVTANAGDDDDAPIDDDGDGFARDEDCDDDDPDVHPDALEVLDGIDNDCDPDTCTGTGFAGRATTWSLPADYGTNQSRYPFEAISQFYGSCSGNYPEYSTLDLTGDRVPDLVITLAPCADDATGSSRWLVHTGGEGGFDADPVEWGLPAGYGTNQSRYPFEATVQIYGSCSANYPEYSTFDLTGDGKPDLVITLAPCADDQTGATQWLVHKGTANGFAEEPIVWTLPAGYGTNQSRYPFESTTQIYGSCSANYPEYSTFDLTGDGLPDMVVTLAPCADDTTGSSRWLVHKGEASGFAAEATEWGLPAGYGSNQSRYPFEATTQIYGSCSANYPEYSTFDLTGDGQPDMVITLAPCADDRTGGTQWLVHEGRAKGFAEAPTDWALPAGYGTNQSRYPFEVTTQIYGSCSANYPEYSTFDLTGDGVPDMVITLSPCADDRTGGDEWRVHAGGSDGFAAESTVWALPAGYGNNRARYPFETTSQIYGSCESNYPEYATFDVTGDGVPDLVLTLSPCADDLNGATQWSVFRGVCDE